MPVNQNERERTDEPRNGDATLDHCPGGGTPGHRWETVDVHLKGHGSLSTFTVEQCEHCEHLRTNQRPKLLDDAPLAER